MERLKLESELKFTMSGGSAFHGKNNVITYCFHDYFKVPVKSLFIT